MSCRLLAAVLVICATLGPARARAANPVYVDDDWAAGVPPGATVIFTHPDGSQSTAQFGTNAFANLQTALNTVDPGGTVHLAPGQYIQRVTVNRSLTLLGPNHDISPNSPANPLLPNAARRPEAVILPPTIDLVNFEASSLLRVTADVSGLAIRGVKFDGDNPALASGVGMLNGQQTDNYTGIYIWGTRTNAVTFSRNIVTRMAGFGYVHGNDLGFSSNGNFVTDSRFEYLGDSSLEVTACFVGQNTYAAINDNAFHLVNGAIQSEFNTLAGPGPYEIRRNTIITSRFGLFYRSISAGAPDCLIEDNDIRGTTDALLGGYGMGLFGIAGPHRTIVRGNFVEGINDRAWPFLRAYRIWNIETPGALLMFDNIARLCELGYDISNASGHLNEGSSYVHASRLIAEECTVGFRILDNVELGPNRGEILFLDLYNSTARDCDVGIQMHSGLSVLRASEINLVNVGIGLETLAEMPDTYGIPSAQLTRARFQGITSSAVRVRRGAVRVGASDFLSVPLGVWVEDDAEACLVAYNNFENAGTQVRNDDPTPLAAPSNWWSATGAVVPSKLIGSVQTNPALAQRPLSFDRDGDGLTDIEEDLNGNGVLDAGETSPLDRDTDGDGIPDGVEVRLGAGYNARNAAIPAAYTDADGDGVPAQDINGDGLPDDPDDNSPDADGNGFADWYEISTGRMPQLAWDYPALGDLDFNGVVDNVDAAIAANIRLGNFAPASHAYWRADVNGNNVRDAADEMAILQFHVGAIEVLPVD